MGATLSLKAIVSQTGSKILASMPRTMVAGQKLCIKAGNVVDLSYAYRCVKRLGWIGYFPDIPWQSQPSSYTPGDDAVCAIIQQEYCKSKGVELFDAGTVWGLNTASYGGTIEGLLMQGTPQALGEHLGLMLQQDFVIGYATGSLFKKGPHRKHFVTVGIVEQIVSLAEYLGVARTECPEQGVPMYALQEGAEALVEKIEQKLGISIGFPFAGGAMGLSIAGRLITPHSLSHLYGALRLKEIIKPFDRPVRIMEIGAGYGGLAYWLFKIAPELVSSYHIIDLPLTNVAQKYFAHKTNTPVTVMTGDALEAVGPVDIVVNQDSFPEMPEREVRRYMAWASANSKLLYSYNQEAYAPVSGDEQVWAHKIAQDYPLALQSRTPSWMRRGYVEEIYRAGA